MFSRKSVFEFSKPSQVSIEELELSLIDYGLEELVRVEDDYIAYGDYTDFGRLHEGFENLCIELKKASLKRMANSAISLSEEQMLEIEKLLDKIEDDEDVQAVYTNIE